MSHVKLPRLPGSGILLQEKTLNEPENEYNNDVEAMTSIIEKKKKLWTF